MTAPTLPICERLREQVHTGSYYSDGYVIAGGDGTFESRSPTPMMRSANRDGPEAACLIETLVSALKLARVAAMVSNFRLSPHELAQIDAALTLAREGAPHDQQ